MKIVFICNGLGHQTFQYIFARWLEEATGESVILNDAQFTILKGNVERNKKLQVSAVDVGAAHNGYEIDYVFPNSKKLIKLSEYFDPDVWEYLISKMKLSKVNLDYLPQLMLEMGFDLKMMIEYKEDFARFFQGKMFYSPVNRYNSDLARIPGNVYYRGGWFNFGFINDYRDIILKDLEFRPVTDARNIEYEREIENSFSVGVHIRRGDFVALDRVITPESYKAIIASLEDKIPGDAKFFVFSNEMDWVKERMEDHGLPKDRTIFVEGNFDFQNNYVDMKFMAKCNVLIAAGNSTFSYLACALNQVPDFRYFQSRGSSTEDIAVMNNPQKLMDAQKAVDALKTDLQPNQLLQPRANRANRRKKAKRA